MSTLVVGASHRTASVDLLERLVVSGEGAVKLRRALLDTPNVHEAVVLSTCNRIEIYADVDRFHGSVDDVIALLAQRAPATADAELMSALYVRYDRGVVGHLFSVASGMDSMVIGETQILGQVREALRAAQDEQTVGPVLNALFQQALRVGKRAHAETGIDGAGRSLVSVALEVSGSISGEHPVRRVCIVGAGSVAALAASTVRAGGVGEVAVVSRTLAAAERLAASLRGQGMAAQADTLEGLGGQIAAADVVISCTGAAGVVVGADVVAAAVSDRAGRPLAIVDLALPHDVAAEAGALPGVTVIGLAEISAALEDRQVGVDVAAVREILNHEVAGFSSAREHDRVAPTVVALRSMATAVVAAEQERLFSRVPELSGRQRDEIERTLRRIVEKLLHEPTVRVKQFAGQVPDASYAEALAALFALDPAVVEALTGPEADG